jgi:hypothetical protein
MNASFETADIFDGNPPKATTWNSTATPNAETSESAELHGVMYK